MDVLTCQTWESCDDPSCPFRFIPHIHFSLPPPIPPLSSLSVPSPQRTPSTSFPWCSPRPPRSCLSAAPTRTSPATTPTSCWGRRTWCRTWGPARPCLTSAPLNRRCWWACQASLSRRTENNSVLPLWCMGQCLGRSSQEGPVKRAVVLSQPHPITCPTPV